LILGNPERSSLAIIVGVQRPGEETDQVSADLDELTRLLETLGISTCSRLIQKRFKLSPGYLLGIGKIHELAEIVKQNKASHVVIDHPLMGAQVKNLEKILCCQVLDRSVVILDIFARNAKSKEAKTQVEIARLEYMLPRMVGAWTHFEKQAGGNIAMRGAGEKQIEIDRRRARDRIGRLQKKLDTITKERETQRKMRRNELKVSIVGYTNGGKTTLMNQLTHSGTKGEDRLFATLDASVRTIDPGTRPVILLSDTVGFIRKLPAGLVASFKSTLEEVLNANLLLHVVDVSSPHYEVQMQATEILLKEIGAGDLPILTIFNKIDLVENSLLAKLLPKKFKNSCVVSSFSQEDIKSLRSYIFNFFAEQFAESDLHVPYDNHAAWSLVHKSCVILDSSYEQEGSAFFHVKASQSVLAKLQEFTISH
jgi:GTP-binding protein HflX